MPIRICVVQWSRDFYVLLTWNVGGCMFKEDAKVASKPIKVEVYIERLMLTLVKWLWRQSIHTQKKSRHQEHH